MKLSLLLLTLSLSLNCGESVYVSSDLGITIIPPKWSADSGLGQNAIFFLKGDGKFSPNVNIQSQNVAFDEFISMSDKQFSEYGMNVILKEVRGNEVWYEYSGTMQNMKLHWLLRACKNGERTLVITGTAADYQWENIKDELKRSMESAKLNK